MILDRDAYAKGRVSLETLELTDCFFAWGKVQADAICSRDEGARAKIRLTGNTVSSASVYSRNGSLTGIRLPRLCCGFMERRSVHWL